MLLNQRISIEFTDEQAGEFLELFRTCKELLSQPRKEVVQQPQKNLLSRKELAKNFKVSEVTIWSWTKKGYLSFSRIGRKVYYQEDIVESELKQIKLKRS